MSLIYQIDDEPGTGPLTEADLDRAIADGSTGRIYHLHRATLAPAGCDYQGRLETRRWHDSAYGRDDDSRAFAAPRVVPCSTLARWWLALRRWWRG